MKNEGLIDVVSAIKAGDPNTDVFVIYIAALLTKLDEALVSATSGSLPHNITQIADELRRHISVLRRIYPKEQSDD